MDESQVKLLNKRRDGSRWFCSKLIKEIHFCFYENNISVQAWRCRGRGQLCYMRRVLWRGLCFVSGSYVKHVAISTRVLTAPVWRAPCFSRLLMGSKHRPLPLWCVFWRLGGRAAGPDRLQSQASFPFIWRTCLCEWGQVKDPRPLSDSQFFRSLFPEARNFL